MSADTPTLTRLDRLHELISRINSAMAFDFCPWANRWVYWLKNPLWVLVLAIAGSAMCAVMLNAWVFVLTALLLVLATCGIVLPYLAIRAIDCRILFDMSRAEFGQPALIRLQVRNRSPLPVWGLSLINGFITSADGSAATDSDGVALARIGGWKTVEFSWPFRPGRRGLYPRGTAEVETGFPFGLFRARRAASVQGQLIVWPQTTALTGLPQAVESRQLAEHFSDRRSGDFGDIMGTRPFRQGDSLRRVHWAQTARQQTLIVTERQAPATSSVRVVLDLRAKSYTGHTEQSLEHTVSIAASLCQLLHENHLRMELSCGMQELVASDRPGDFERLMDCLAVVGQDQADTALRDRSSAGFQVVVTTPEGCRADRPWQVVVAGDHQAEQDIPGAWMVVRSGQDLREQFARQWQQEAHHA